MTEARAAQADPKFIPPQTSSLNLQFECGSPSEVNDVYKRLIAAGYAGYAEPWDTFWGQRFGRVSDPDDRIVNIYASLAE